MINLISIANELSEEQRRLGVDHLTSGGGGGGGGEGGGFDMGITEFVFFGLGSVQDIYCSV